MGRGDGAEGKRKPRFTIGKETTYVTGPLDEDGYIDYVAALNERMSKGVTPENNANVVIWKAFGPHPEGSTMPPEFFKWLGYQPPEKGDYWVHLGKHMKENLNPMPQGPAADLIFEQHSRSMQRPWKGSDYPAIDSWLKVLKSDKRAIFTAASKAQQAADYITRLAESGLGREVAA